MEISCWSFIRMAHLAGPLMTKGGTLFTMTYYGSQMVEEHYNIMDVAKAALESAVRYMAAELDPALMVFLCSQAPPNFSRRYCRSAKDRHTRPAAIALHS